MPGSFGERWRKCLGPRNYQRVRERLVWVAGGEWIRLEEAGVMSRGGGNSDKQTTFLVRCRRSFSSQIARDITRRTRINHTSECYVDVAEMLQARGLARFRNRAEKRVSSFKRPDRSTFSNSPNIPNSKSRHRYPFSAFVPGGPTAPRLSPRSCKCSRIGPPWGLGLGG